MRTVKLVSLVVLTALAAWFVLTRRPNLMQRNDTLDPPAAPAVQPDPQAGAKEAAMQLTTPDFPPGGTLPRACTADGADRSPALAWSGAPEGTGAFALVVDDPDAPAGLWVHWVCYDLPGTAAGLAPDQPRTPGLAGGASQGSNSWGRTGWNGPSPPPGRPHRYFFKLYALDRPLGLAPGATARDLEAAMQGRVLAQAEVMGTYGR
jgi:Raf kinase inhibitor-like YbhB/YbcL family protein